MFKDSSFLLQICLLFPLLNGYKSLHVRNIVEKSNLLCFYHYLIDGHFETVKGFSSSIELRSVSSKHGINHFLNFLYITVITKIYLYIGKPYCIGNIISHFQISCHHFRFCQQFEIWLLNSVTLLKDLKNNISF